MINPSSFRGILGLGSVSTNYYLQRIHQKYKDNNQEFSTCPFLLYQIDFQELNPFLPNDFEVLKPKLENYLEQVHNLGVTKLLIPNISLHETLDQIESPFQICHALDLTLKYLKENNITSITLFGTNYTMNAAYIKEKFKSENIAIVLPQKEDQVWIDDFRKAVYTSSTTLSQESEFHDLIRKYGKKKPVVLACTELSVFSLKEESLCVDMAERQIEEFLKPF